VVGPAACALGEGLEFSFVPGGTDFAGCPVAGLDGDVEFADAPQKLAAWRRSDGRPVRPRPRRTYRHGWGSAMSSVTCTTSTRLPSANCRPPSTAARTACGSAVGDCTSGTASPAVMSLLRRLTQSVTQQRTPTPPRTRSSARSSPARSRTRATSTRSRPDRRHDPHPAVAAPALT